MDTIVVFTDRDGDVLSVTPRDQNGYGDPIITITHRARSKNSESLSVIYAEDTDLAWLLVNLIKATKPTKFVTDFIIKEIQQ